MNNMRILAIDYGDSRVGIAITDVLGIIAQGLETINSGGSDKVILRRIAELVENYDVEKFVIGNPLNCLLIWSTAECIEPALISTVNTISEFV